MNLRRVINNVELSKNENGDLLADSHNILTDRITSVSCECTWC